MTSDVDWLLTRLDGFLPHTIQAEAAATIRTLRAERDSWRQAARAKEIESLRADNEYLSEMNADLDRVNSDALAEVASLRADGARLQTLADGRAALGLNAIFMAEAIGVEGVEAARLDYEQTLTAPLRAAIAAREATIAAIAAALPRGDMHIWQSAEQYEGYRKIDAVLAEYEADQEAGR